MNAGALNASRALWNRSHLELRSDEVVAQLLDRGDLPAWRELFRLARADAELRDRIARVICRVPLAYGHFWLAALRLLGHPIPADTQLPKPGPEV